MTLDPANLRLRIDEAFGRMPYPGDEHIVSKNRGYDGDLKRTKRTLKGLHWRDVSFEILDNLRVALTFMSPEGFRFYLPAYMIISIMDFYRADVIPDRVIGALTLPHASDFDRTREQLKDFPAAEIFPSIDWEKTMESITETYRPDEEERTFLERVSGFDEAQRKVIRQFLEYIRDAYSAEFLSEDAETAIERYWHRF